MKLFKKEKNNNYPEVLAKALTYNEEKLSEYLSTVSQNDLDRLMNDDIFLEHLFSSDNHYAFVWAYSASLTNKKIIINKKVIEYILKDKRVNDKINAIIYYDNIPEELIDYRIFDIIYRDSKLIDYIKNGDNKFGLSFAKYLLDKDKNLTTLGYLNDDVLKYVVSNKYIYTRLCEQDNKNFLFALKPKAFEKLVEEPSFKKLLIESEIYQISKLLDSNYKFPTNLYDYKEFRNTFINEPSIYKYRMFIEKLKLNNIELAERIEIERNKYYDNKINSILDNGLLPDYNEIYEKTRNGEFINFYNDNTNIVRMLYSNIEDKIELEDCYKYSDKEVTEIFIDRLFKDSPDNFYKNLKVLIEYNNSLENKAIPSYHLELYKKIYNYYDLPIEEKINMYNKLKDFNLYEIFYDDYRASKDLSYEELNDKALKLKDLKPIGRYDKIEVYELNGQPFNAYIHVTYSPRDHKNNAHWNNTHNKEFVSISYIGDQNITNYSKNNEYVIVGFENLSKDRIIHVYHEDSYSYEAYNDTGLNTTYINQILTKEQLLDKTNTYNEIIYKEKDTILKPDYVIAYDEVKINDYNYAKTLNIPIVLLDTKKYNYRKEASGSIYNPHRKYSSFRNETEDYEYSRAKVITKKR